MNEEKPLILIAEDDVDLAQFSARLLKRQGYDVLVANTVAEARMFSINNKPDLFVLDIGLPDGDGRLFCEELRRDTDAPVLFLTGKTDTEDKIKGFNTGGDYYLTKPYDRDEFIAIVKSLLRRMDQNRKKIDEVTAIKRGPITLMKSERKAYVNERDTELTPKEFDILFILMQNEDRELTCEQIYETVWGTKMNNDPHPIRLHISRLKKKLNEEAADDFNIFTEYGRGYTFTTR